MDNRKRAVALGLFDGVHLGHRAVIDAALAQRGNGLSSAVFTFEPECVLRKAGGSAGYIYTRAEKEWLLCEQIGVDDIISPPLARNSRRRYSASSSELHTSAAETISDSAAGLPAELRSLSTSESASALRSR